VSKVFKSVREEIHDVLTLGSDLAMQFKRVERKIGQNQYLGVNLYREEPILQPVVGRL
jgi:hypothetical protein